MWANAQRDGRPTEYRWRSLFNAAKFGKRPLVQRVHKKRPPKYNGVVFEILGIFTTEFSTYVYIVCQHSWKLNVT